MTEHFTDNVDYKKESKKPKVVLGPGFLNLFTLEQLDMWNAGVKKHIESSSAWTNPSYFKIYINKYFSNELTEETQASLTPEEKIVVLKKIRDFFNEKVTSTM